MTLCFGRGFFFGDDHGHHRDLRHHPPRRLPTRGNLPQRVRQAPYRGPPRRAGCGLHRRRLARGPAQGRRVLPPGPVGARPHQRHPGRLRFDPPTPDLGGLRPPAPGAPRRRDRGDLHRRQGLGLPRDRGAAHRPGRGGADGGGEHRVPASPRPPGLLRRRTFLRRLPLRPRVRPRRRSGRPGGRGGTPRPLRHQRRHPPPRDLGGGPPGPCRPHRRRAGGPLPQRRRMCGRLLLGGGPGRRPADPRVCQRVRRTHGKRRPVHDHPRPGVEDGHPGRRRRPAREARPDLASHRRSRQHRTRRPPALRGSVRLHPQSRPPHVGPRPPSRRLRARPTPQGRQPNPHGGLRAGGTGLDRGEGSRTRPRPGRRHRSGGPRTGQRARVRRIPLRSRRRLPGVAHPPDPRVEAAVLPAGVVPGVHRTAGTGDRLGGGDGESPRRRRAGRHHRGRGGPGARPRPGTPGCSPRRLPGDRRPPSHRLSGAGAGLVRRDGRQGAGPPRDLRPRRVVGDHRGAREHHRSLLGGSVDGVVVGLLRLGAEPPGDGAPTTGEPQAVTTTSGSSNTNTVQPSRRS